jgi:ribose-phosphate pyrophosphokinase
MILFSFPEYQETARLIQILPSIEYGQFQIHRFNNHELYAAVQTPVANQHCLVLGSIAPPDEQALSLLLLAHTLKKEGAQRITAVLPYLAYSRQDKSKPGESLGAAWMGSLLAASGVDEVLTVDVHSGRDHELFPIPLLSLSPARLFATAIKSHRLEDAVFVAPDNGAIPRCEAVKAAAGMEIGETPYFEKRRTETGITHSGPIGAVGPRVVVVDDMLDTGATLVSACEKLKQAKVENIYIFVTHGLFTGTLWMELWPLGVEHIFCTDTVPLRSEIDAARISVLSVLPLLRDGLSSRAKEAATSLSCD